MQRENPVLRPRLHDAVIFDLDGVVTRTARLHAAAWKAIFDEYLQRRADPAQAPFDLASDYRRYVDGKPRYDGVRSFLQSRGIALPEGSPDDPPERETVSGLGNRKDARFLQLLGEKGAEAFDSTLALIRALGRAGIRTAVVSSSRNCVAVLESVGALDLFDAKVDGVDAEKAGLDGKPAPDIFLEAARRLGVSPRRAVVVEDALAGVEAGRAGGFALVIGVDRAGQADALNAHGADVVVKDLAEVSVEETALPPSALASLGAIVESFGERPPALFLDYDGTLTPIVERPELAELSEGMRGVLQRMAALCTLSVISGRDLQDVRARVGVRGIWYAGSHGFDIAGPGGAGHAPEAARAALPQLDEVEAELRERLQDVSGVLLERKRFGLAVHTRMVESGRENEVEAAVDQALVHRKLLRKGRGKKVFELLPDIDWDKGAALNWLRKALNLGDETRTLYVGDDVTDEDAFRVLEDRGIGIVVTEAARPTAARYSLGNPRQVEQFLDALAVRLERRS